LTHIPSPHDTHCLTLARDEEFLTDTVAAFVHEGLIQEGPVLLITTPRRWRAIRSQLEARGDEVAAAMDNGRLAVLEAGSALNRLYAGGQLDEARLATEIVPVLERLRHATNTPHVRAYGDIVDHLWQRRETAAALRLENAWHELLKLEDVTLLCACNADPLDETQDAAGLMSLCRSHGRIHAMEGSARRREAIRRAMDEVLGIREVGRLEIVIAAAGLPSGDGAAELTLLWLRTQVPHLAHRVLVQARRLLDSQLSLRAVNAR